MPRMSYERFAHCAKAMGMVPGRLHEPDHQTPEVIQATADRKAKGLLAPGFFLEFNGKRHYGSITDLTDAYFGLAFYEVFKILESTGEFVETHKVFARKRSPWEALMLVTCEFANHEAPGFTGIYGETAGDLRIADRDGLHWWMVNYA